MPQGAPWARTLATGGMLAIAASPSVVLFPEPPVFGCRAAALFATFATLATVGTYLRGTQRTRDRVMGRAAWLLATTLAAILLRAALWGHELIIPTPDLLERLFGLQGEDVDQAFLYEVWLELWLATAALMLLLATWLRRIAGRRPDTQAAPPGTWDDVVPGVLPPWRWGLPTIGVWLIGWAAMAGAVLKGHQTAWFLTQSVQVIGHIAGSRPHPLIRLTTADGATVQFVQNGYVSRKLGASVPVAYRPDNPAGTAQADTFWARWSNTMSLAWIGLGFTLAPFFGFRAVLWGWR